MGGFTFRGRAWRLRLTESLILYGDSTANNVLEFLAITITIWLSLLKCDERSLTNKHLLGLSDSTSVIGWIFKSSLIRLESKYYKVINMIARKLTRLVTDSSHSLASQHCRGKFNIVADYLLYEARDCIKEGGSVHPLAPSSVSNNTLTSPFHTYLPQLIPKHFEIKTLPREIFYWASPVVSIAEQSWKDAKKGSSRTVIECSGDGGSSVDVSGSTRSLEEFPQELQISSVKRSHLSFRIYLQC